MKFLVSTSKEFKFLFLHFSKVALDVVGKLTLFVGHCIFHCLTLIRLLKLILIHIVLILNLLLLPLLFHIIVPNIGRLLLVYLLINSTLYHYFIVALGCKNSMSVLLVFSRMYWSILEWVVALNIVWWNNTLLSNSSLKWTDRARCLIIWAKI